MKTRSALPLLLLTACLLVGAPLRAQDRWGTPFNHAPSGPEVHLSSDSLANPSWWITEDIWPNAGNNTRFNAIHACLIPSGPHRGEVLVLDGNLRQVGTRVHEPWSIVNPYWPMPNPVYANFHPPGYIGYRFHNATLLMPGTHAPGAVLQGPGGAGELFCGGQCWLANGRLFLAGGTLVYPMHPTLGGLPQIQHR